MLKKRKKQVLYRFRTLTSRYAEISQDSSIENRQTIAKSAAFCSFVPLQRKTQFLRQNLVAKAAKTLVGMTWLWVKHSFPDAKTVMSTERSEWRHLETVVKVRRILSHKDFLGLECKSPAMRKPARSLHAPDGLVGMTGRYRRNDLRGSRGAPLVGVRKG